MAAVAEPRPGIHPHAAHSGRDLLFVVGDTTFRAAALNNKASAPTVGTDVPILTIPVAATSTVAFEFGPYGKRFATGIAIAATGGILATDTANAVVGAQISASYV